MGTWGMDRIQSMEVFVRVAHEMGFARAARGLRLSTAAVSKHVNALEEHVGTRLFDRTTRKVGLTEAGRVYLERCQECLQALDDADGSVGALATAPRGVLRVTAPIDFGEALYPVLVTVMRKHPELRIDVNFSNRKVDMVEEGFDLALRVAPSLDGQYVARPIALTTIAFYGSPAYFKKHGRPRRPEELARHRNILFGDPRPIDTFTFTRGRSQVRVTLANVVLASNSGLATLAAVHAGLGLAQVASFETGADVAAGRIEAVLPDWRLPEYKVWACYPHRRFLSPKVKVFIEAMQEEFGDGTRDPWWIRR
jgi:DNA-binding transcriptional LysR family regulator